MTSDSGVGFPIDEYNYGTGTPDVKSVWNTGDFEQGGSPFAYVESLRNSYYG